MNLYINLQKPVVVGAVSWSTEERAAGKLSFKILRDDELKFEEGDPVRLDDVFYGFVFSKSYDKEGIISVTAYDQVVYLAKNKDSIVYSNKKASTLIEMLGADFRLNLGEIDDTRAHLSRIEDNVTILDIIYNALDDTLLATKEKYILYDSFGKLTLRNLEKMKTNVLIDAESAENFQLSSSIDDDVYNQIKLIYDNEEKGVREVFIAKHGENINKWGLLQYYESVDDAKQAQKKAEGLLELYNRKKRSLTVKGVRGNASVRAGSLVAVQLDLGEIRLAQMMMVTSAKHNILDTEHTMDLTLKGGEIG